MEGRVVSVTTLIVACGKVSIDCSLRGNVLLPMGVSIELGLL